MDSTIEEAKAEIEKFLNEAKRLGVKDLKHVVYFSWIPPLTTEVIEKRDEYHPYKAEKTRSWLGISYEYGDRTVFTDVLLSVSGPTYIPPEVNETILWYFQQVVEMSMTTKDEFEAR